ncbi:MAG: PH domain-containing protein [Anaerostipes sp.]|jgi:hypothetical protein|nr:PH domain-containing protein [Anaerostipes sp.]
MSAGQLENTLIWTFTSPCNIPDDVTETFIDGEKALHAFKTIRDVAIFTNKRIIVRDAQGITGKKVETYSLPYTSIKMYSTENAGKILDINSEVELWTMVGHIKINLNKKINIREFDKLISNAIL